ncbi:hypothetical protein CJ030_MR7G013048 [Morella rubra]|uniref:Sn1-specific diacylglycerol lipase alpha n=1 Tax=Morella rubra TaxID=262757 RepID=A0A6A1V6Q9_9ROSI|nr:hypothetical protein CJ030_MR7G013048 [Morella rubra]
MSFSCGVECVLCLGCTRWAWKRCTHVGSDDSATWPLATPDEFEHVPRICSVILAVYESDLSNPQFQPPGENRVNPDRVVKRVTYDQTQGRAPPYLIYCDHDRREIVLAIRGLNLVKESDYQLLLDNRLGMQMFDGGYVHHGLLKSAIWLLNQESDTLRRLWIENGSNYDMIFAGHSLGSGVAALVTVIVVNHRDRLGGIPRKNIRCYAVAPARCMSLNLAVKCGRFPPEVRTAIPVEERFEHIVLSCNATSDHAIIWIVREAEKALERMRESTAGAVTTAPKVLKLERLLTIEKEHKDALERAVSLNVPHAVTVTSPEDAPAQVDKAESSVSQIHDASKTTSKSTGEGLTGMKWLKSFSKG